MRNPTISNSRFGPPVGADRPRTAEWRDAQVVRLLAMPRNGHWLRRLRTLVNADLRVSLQLGQALLKAGDAARRRLGADIYSQLAPVVPRTIRATIGERLLARLTVEADAGVISSIVIALGHADYEPAADAVLALVDHPDAAVRHAITFSLPSLAEHDRAAAALRRLSRDPEASVRDWATFDLAIRHWNDAETIAVFLARADDRHADTRCEAIFGLARRHHPAAAALIERELRHYWKSELVERAKEELDGEPDPDQDPPGW